MTHQDSATHLAAGSPWGLAMDAFEFTAGSVLGRDHALVGRNNQDAWTVWQAQEALLAVVCDGCGSGRFSETGAQAGSRMVIEALRSRLHHLDQGPQAYLELVRLDLLGELGRLAAALGGSAEAVGQHLLFTIVGAVIAPAVSILFALGDGVLAVNGGVEVLSSADNAPAYLAYALNGASQTAADAPRFDLRHVLPTSQVSSLLIGSDGVADLMAAAPRRLPGREEVVGPLRQLWTDDRFFANPATLTRRLHLLNRPSQRIDWEGRRIDREGGLLRDDTTLVVIRRKGPRP